MAQYRVIKNGIGIDSKARKKGEIVIDEQIGDTVQTFIDRKFIEPYNSKAQAPATTAPPVITDEEADTHEEANP